MPPAPTLALVPQWECPGQFGGSHAGPKSSDLPDLAQCAGRWKQSLERWVGLGPKNRLRTRCTAEPDQDESGCRRQRRSLRSVPYQAPPIPQDIAGQRDFGLAIDGARGSATQSLDRKSTRLNSSHVSISYAVF